MCVAARRRSRRVRPGDGVEWEGSTPPNGDMHVCGLGGSVRDFASSAAFACGGERGARFRAARSHLQPVYTPIAVAVCTGPKYINYIS